MPSCRLPVLLLATALLAAVAPDAGAAPAMPTPVAPTAGAALPIAEPVTLAARPPVAGQPMTIAVSPLPATDDRGFLSRVMVRRAANPGEDPTTGQISLSPFEVEGRPGRYYWQAIVWDGAAQVPGPVGTFSLELPASARVRGPIPRSIGRHGTTRFYLSATGIPTAVGRTRFGILAREAGKRWGLTPLRFTSARSGRADGWSIVGFGRRVDGEALGVERDLVARVYRRQRRCMTLRSPSGELLNRSCKLGPKVYVGRRLIERDVTIRSDLQWSTRRDAPEVDRYDLESVILHELGHMAGNKAHQGRCADSPMVVSLGRGEWWHTPEDHFQFGCDSDLASRISGVASPGLARQASAAPAPRGRFIHHVVYADDVVLD